MRPSRNLLLVSTACAVAVALAAQSTDTVDWQTAAGGKMALFLPALRKTGSDLHFWVCEPRRPQLFVQRDAR
jgi:hypothetical protein